MWKLLLFGLLILTVYLIVRGKNDAKHAPPSGSRPVEQMVMCAHCGVHLPQTESLKSGQLYFCCEHHRGLGPVDRKI